MCASRWVRVCVCEDMCVRHKPTTKQPRKEPKATRRNPKPRAILCVHQGQETRTPIEEETWQQVFRAFNLKLQLAVMSSNWNTSFWIEGSHWKEGRAIIACNNEKTVNTFIEMISEIEINGVKFRAWPINEFPRLSTTYHPTQQNRNIWRCMDFICSPKRPSWRWAWQP